MSWLRRYDRSTAVVMIGSGPSAGAGAADPAALRRQAGSGHGVAPDDANPILARYARRSSRPCCTRTTTVTFRPSLTRAGPAGVPVACQSPSSVSGHGAGPGTRGALHPRPSRTLAWLPAAAAPLAQRTLRLAPGLPASAAAAPAPDALGLGAARAWCPGPSSRPARRRARGRLGSVRPAQPAAVGRADAKAGVLRIDIAER